MRARAAVWAIVALALAFGVPFALGTPKPFTDPAGDSGAAPDVTSVTADDTASTLVFTVTIANRATLADNDLVAILVDSDRRLTTGADGADYAAGFTGAGVNLAKWNGSAFVAVAHGSYTATYAGGVVTFRILKTDLGISTAFDFSVVANKGTDQLRPEDDAPDTGTWTYATQVQPPAPTLRRVSVVFVPATPRAGRIFAVARAVGHLTDGSSVSPGTSGSLCRRGKRGRSRRRSPTGRPFRRFRTPSPRRVAAAGGWRSSRTRTPI